MPAVKKPYDVRIGGEVFTVVFTAPTFWVDSTGQAHIGALWKKLEPPVILDRKSKPKTCAKCKKPTWTQTHRGRAIHVACEGFSITLPDDVEADHIMNLALAANADIIYPEA